MWNMSFGFFGIQFGFALQNVNTSRIFETMGAKPESLAVLWLAAPITGLLVQPLIGFYSDRTWHPVWGRRRPYFAVGAILASLALCLMPNSSALWMAVGALWIMDASINISMEPFRALVGDMLPPSQRTTGFALQSLFIGTGAVVASSLPWIFTNWFNIPNAELQQGEIPDSVKYSFYIGSFMLFVSVMWTVLSTKEYPPAPGDEEKLRNREKRKIENENITQARLKRYGFPLLLVGLVFSLIVFFANAEKELYILGFVFCLFGVVFLLAAQYISQGRSYLGFVHIAKDFITMPKTMVQLAYVQFFSWFALFSMWIYSTPAVTSYIYKTSDATTLAYNEGANLVGILFAAYNGIAALAALTHCSVAMLFGSLTRLNISFGFDLYLAARRLHRSAKTSFGTREEPITSP